MYSIVCKIGNILCVFIMSYKGWQTVIIVCIVTLPHLCSPLPHHLSLSLFAAYVICMFRFFFSIGVLILNSFYTCFMIQVKGGLDKDGSLWHYMKYMIKSCNSEALIYTSMLKRFVMAFHISVRLVNVRVFKF